MSFKLFILWIALNAAPASITSLILTSPDKQAVEYAKQADGGWKAVAADQRSDSTIYSTKTELAIASAEGKRMSIPAAEMMGIKGEIDWQTAESLPVGRGVLKIQRQADGLDLSIHSAGTQERNDAQQIYTVRWKEITDNSVPKKEAETAPKGTKAN